MQREFLPVGQGAFYHESFEGLSGERINVIYDCGSSSGVEQVHRQFNEIFETAETIQAIFLSHFHEDHVNGLEYLLKHYRVKHIFFPLLTKEDKQLVFLNQISSSTFADENPFWIRFAENPFETLRQMQLDYSPFLHFVSSRDGDNENEEFRAELRDFSPWSDVIPSGKDVSELIFDETDIEYRPDWLYIPFHFREKVRREKLKVALENSIGTCNPEELLDLLKRHPSCRIDIQKVYEQIPGGFNPNSMLLYSGIDHHPVDWPAFLEKSWPWPETNRLTVPGALYMGDYEVCGSQKWQEFQDAYQKYFPYIGCLQVPHHGSNYNFNFRLLDIEHCDLYVISASTDNKYKHPDGEVIIATIKNIAKD